MKKTVSVVYTVFVVVALLGVIAFFGWKTYQSRSARIGDFTANADIYTEKLADSLSESRDVNAEVAIAESIMNEDPSLIAIQVYSHDDGLRLSVVKPPADEFSRTSLADSEKFDNWLTKIRYHKEIRPMSINDMRGLEAVYVSTTLSSAEIQNNLMIILITIIGLFAITLVLILVRPRSGHADEQERDEESQFSDDMDEFSIPDDMNEEMNDSMTSADDDFDLPDFDPQDRLDESDLMSGDPEFGESLSLDDDFDLPDLDNPPGNQSDILDRLDSELERAASFNQDLSFILFSGADSFESRIKESYTSDDLVFPLGSGLVAVMEINQDLDSTLSMTEDFVRGSIEQLGRRVLRAGIASRNGRLIGAESLYNEAENALNRTDDEKNIVAFRSDPEKYRAFLKSQEN
jgi:hypothetical protein